MKNSTVNSGNSRSKINSVGVGQPNNRRKSAIVKSMVSPASMPATNPQKIDLMSGRGGETVELTISQFSREIASPFQIVLDEVVGCAYQFERPKALTSIIIIVSPIGSVTRFGPRKDHRGVNLISDTLPFGPLWYDGPNAAANAIGYAKFYSRSHDAVMRVYDDAGNLIETHEQRRDFKEP